jgi:Tol biopolymer transport system component
MAAGLSLFLASATTPAIGPNGLIAYACEADGGLNTDICTLDPATGEVVNLTNDSAHDAFPNWSPDGTKIVFDSFRSTNQPTIHVMNADGTDITQISATPCCDRDFQPVWSPDGTRIVFVSTRDEDGEYELYVMDAEGELVGAPAVRLTNDPAPEFGQGMNDWQATWSPDSQRIAFVSNRDPDEQDACDIYVMDVTDADGDGFGDNLTRLTFDNDFECEIKSPAWSPTGEQIAFTSTRSNDYEIWVMNSDGTNLVNVTNFPGQDFDAGWSPDGTQIIFVSGRDGDYELYSTPAPPPGPEPFQRAEGTEPPPVTQLTHNTTNDQEPDWGPARALQLTSASSRKTHGNVGTFDIALPLVGVPAVECRNAGGNHKLVFTFTNDVVNGSASVTSGIGRISRNPTFADNTMIVNLTGVANEQKITVALNNVTDSFSQVFPTTQVTLNLLLGDTNSDNRVNVGDTNQTRFRSGQITNQGNFRNDVNLDGRINVGDTNFVRAHAGDSSL